VEQSYSNFEYIIIDGGSTDGSCQFLEKYKERFSYLVSEPDNGIYNAMNKGIKASKGDYLLFLNSGDMLNGENALKTFIEHKDFGGDIIYGDYKFDKGGKVYPDSLTPLKFFKSSLPHQSTFIIRSLFFDFGLYNEDFKIVSDWEFFIKCFLSEKVKFKHVNQPLSVYDLNGVSNNINSKINHDKEREIVLKKYFKLYYDDYLLVLSLENEIKNIKRKTLKGFLNRIKKRLLK
jgi:glycosyltransferase involved in cell wall biosynthesis